MTRRRVDRNKNSNSLESKRLHYLYKKGLIDQIEVLDSRARNHGFKNQKDMTKHIKMFIMESIYLKRDHTPLTKSSLGTILKIISSSPETVEMKCACCGESHEEFLTIDHIHNNGMEHRKSVGSGFSLYIHMITRGFKASDYQILCFNCNSSLGFRGYCPHHPEIKREVYTNPRKSCRITEQDITSESLFDF